MAAKKAKKNDEEIETEPVVTEPDPEEEEIVIDVPEEAEPTVDDLPGVGPATAEKLRRAVLLLNSGNDTPNIPKITASFGVASLAKDTHSAHEWLQSADKALYHAKESGRDQTTLYQHRPS